MRLSKILIVGLAASLAACSVTNHPRPTPAAMTTGQRPEVLTRLGDDMLRSGDAGAALGLYQMAQAAAPHDDVPLVRMGDALTELDDVARAEQAYRGALLLAPGDVDARRGLALSLLAQGQAREALSILQKLDDGSADLRILRAEGTALDVNGRSRQAQDVYRRALQRAPVDAALHGNLALSLALSGDKAQALDEMRAATGSPAPDPRQNANAVLVLALVGQSEAARQRGMATVGPEATQALLARAATAMSDRGQSPQAQTLGVLTSQPKLLSQPRLLNLQGPFNPAPSAPAGQGAAAREEGLPAMKAAAPSLP